MVIQFLIIVIFEIHIVHNLDLHASKLIKIAEADINEYPTSTKTEYIDQNTEISVTENLHDPDIVFYLSKHSHANNKLYVTKNRGESVIYKHFEFNKRIISVGDVIPLKDYMFCFNQEGSLGFYVNKDFVASHFIEISTSNRYYINSELPNMIIRSMMPSQGENSIDISIDFGVTYRFLRNQVIQSHWIESTDQLVLLLKRNILEIWEINSTGYNKLYTTNNVKTYFIEKDKLIIIFMESNVEAQLSIWESPTKTILTSFFPKLLVIKDIYNVNILHKNVYVTLLNSHDLNCLYTSEYKNLKFVKKICSLSKSSATGNCPAYVHPNLEGVLYANLIDDDSKVSSSFSANNGRSWIKMDFKSSTSECEMKKCKFILNLPCDPKYGSIKGNGRINIKSGHLYYDDEILSTTFISFDGGKTWKYTPSIDFQPLILNRGGNVIFFKKQSKNIYFSFDEGNSWKYFQLFPENQLILYSSSGGINKDEFSNVVTSNGANIFFNIIKFSNIFNRPCQTSDYINWIPERVHGTCFQGKETVYVMKKTNSLCVDSFSSEREAAHSPCHCTIDDFDCRFNYYTVDGLCVLDPDSGITEEPQHCKPGSHYVSHIAG